MFSSHRLIMQSTDSGGYSDKTIYGKIQISIYLSVGNCECDIFFFLYLLHTTSGCSDWTKYLSETKEPCNVLFVTDAIYKAGLKPGKSLLGRLGLTSLGELARSIILIIEIVVIVIGCGESDV